MHYEVHGLSSRDAPTLVFSSGLGGAAHFWNPQLDAFTNTHRVITYDQLGTGRSPAVLPENYSITDMANELLALLDELKVNQCHFVGHALGGLVGLQIATFRPTILQSLVLANAWSSSNPHTQRCFAIRKAILASGKKDIYLQMQALILYPPDWIVANIDALEQEEAHLKVHFPDEQNLLARIQALSGFNIESELSCIHTPTLAIANKDDTLVPWQCSDILANQMPNASLTLMEYGGHASSVTVPAEFNQLLRNHLSVFA